MSETEFWRIISCINVRKLEQGDANGAVWPVQKALSSKTELELAAFEEVLAQKLYAIDGKVYAMNAGESGTSDDGFLYARLYVLAKGREFYEMVRTNPEGMPKSIDQWCEALLYAHKYAWETLTGKSASLWPFFPSVSYESGSNGDLWRH